jgi:hypothetical protein
VPISGDARIPDHLLCRTGEIWKIINVLSDVPISRVTSQRSEIRVSFALGGAPTLLRNLRKDRGPVRRQSADCLLRAHLRATGSRTAASHRDATDAFAHRTDRTLSTERARSGHYRDSFWDVRGHLCGWAPRPELRDRPAVFTGPAVAAASCGIQSRVPPVPEPVGGSDRCAGTRGSGGHRRGIGAGPFNGSGEFSDGPTP